MRISYIWELAVSLKRPHQKETTNINGKKKTE